MEIKFSGTFNKDDNHYLFSHEFQIENEVKTLKIEFNVREDYQFRCVLWDSNHIVRLQYLHGKAWKTIVIDEKECSMGVYPGPIPIGTWKMDFFSYEAEYHPTKLEVSCDYEIQIEYGNDILNENTSILSLGNHLWVNYEKENNCLTLKDYDWTEKKNDTMKWYKGDFHTHTRLSDGEMSPDEEIIEAEKSGLDFFVVTEHNIIPTGWTTGNCLVIPGVEITSTKGHFNILGIKKWVNLAEHLYDNGLETEKGMSNLMDTAKKMNALISINHCMLSPWSWQFKETKLNEINTIEVCCSPTFPGSADANDKVLTLWNTLWNDGHNIWGIGGSDSHLLPGKSYAAGGSPDLIGDPGTFVLANALSADEILDSVKKGRVYISRGPVLDIKIMADNHIYYPGSDLTEIFTSEDKAVKIGYTLGITNLNKKLKIMYLQNGEVINSEKIDCDGIYKFETIWSGKDYSWMRIEMRDEEDNFVLCTNPIFKGSRKQSLKNWGQLYVNL